MKTSQRNLGIDILRIASMIGVVFLHVLGHGGILLLNHSPAKFTMVWFLEILSYPAVNCFVLISGYVGYRGEKIFPKVKYILSLLFTVVFYSVLFFLLFKFWGPETLGLKELIKSLFPTLLKKYWFFSAYFGLFFLSPLLNLLVYKSSFKHSFIFLSLFLMLCIVSTVYDTFSILGGYSLIWLVFLYSIGAIFKKYDLNKLISKRKWLIIAFVAFTITWLSKVVLHFTNIPFLQSHSSILVTYVSPTVIIMALGLLNWFSKINCPSSLSPIISFFASSAFSVYLIHDNNYVRNYLISKFHLYIGNFNFISLSLSIIGLVALIFISCILIDKIRIIIFKFIKIDKLAERIEQLIKTVLNDIYTRLKKHLNLTSE